MLTCDQCSDLLLDFVYDLLDEDEALQLREHLADCAEWQYQLASADDTQRLFGKAAQVYLRVPEFSIPETSLDSSAPDDFATTPASRESESRTSDTEDTQELEAAPADLGAGAAAISEHITTASPQTTAAESQPNRSLPRPSAFVWYTLATAALLLVSLTGWCYSTYKTELEAKRGAVRKLELSIARIDGEWKDNTEEYEKQLAKLPTQAKQEGLFLRLYGSQDYRPSTTNVVRLEAQDLDAKRVPIRVNYTVAKADGTTLHTQKSQLSPDGTCALEIPPRLGVPAKEELKLLVEARVVGGRGRSSLRETLVAKQPQFISHLTLNKSVYRTNDILFFRTLTLDRFRLTPPNKELQFRYSIVNSSGSVVKSLLSKSTKDGIGGGEFALTEEFAAGAYSLLVEPIDDEGNVADFLPPLRQQFVLRRGQRLLVAFRRPRFGVGDKIEVQVCVEDLDRSQTSDGKAGGKGGKSTKKGKILDGGSGRGQTRSWNPTAPPQTVTAQLVLTNPSVRRTTAGGTGAGRRNVGGVGGVPTPVTGPNRPVAPPGLPLPGMKDLKQNGGANKWPLPKNGLPGVPGGPAFGGDTAYSQQLALPPMQSSVTPDAPANFTLPVPPGVVADQMEVKVKLEDGIKNPVVCQPVPLVSGGWDVEFFPEGGHLVQGVPNTVYARVTTAEDYRRKPLSAKLVDHTGRVIKSFQLPPLPPTQDVFSRIGRFRFTPGPKGKYKLKVVAATIRGKKPKTLADGDVPQARDGVAMTVANPVDSQNVPVRLKLFTSTPKEDILVLATCRGHGVSQSLCTATRKGTAVELAPIKGTRGVVRITAYKVTRTELVPVAERLVFRFPKGRLKLSATASLDRTTKTQRKKKRADQMALRLDCRNEKDNRWAANALVGITKEDTSLTSESRNTPDLPSYVYLLKDLQEPSDLDDSQLVASDSPANRKRLNELLAVHGWREFVPVAEPTDRTKKPDNKATEKNAREAEPQRASEPNVLYADNRLQTKGKLEKSLREKREAIELARKTKHQELLPRRHEAIEQMQSAKTALAKYRTRPQTFVSVSILATLAMLLIISLSSMLLGFYRLAQNHAAATRHLALACGLLFVALVLYGSTSAIRNPRSNASPQDGSMRVERGALGLENQFRQPPAPEIELPQPLPLVPTTRLVAQRPRLRRERTAGEENSVTAKEQKASQTTSPVFVVQSAGRSNGQMFEKATLRNSVVKDWFVRAQRRQESDTEMARLATKRNKRGATKNSTPSQAKKPHKKETAKGGGKDGTGGKGKSLPAKTGPKTPSGRVYFGRYVTRRFAWTAAQTNEELPDTLLWAPAVQLNKDGKTELKFEIPQTPAVYRMIVIGNDNHGRFGYLERMIQPGKPPRLVK